MTPFPRLIQVPGSSRPGIRLLSGHDASLLYQETPEVPAHTLKLLVLSTDWTAEQLRQRISDRAGSLDVLHWRLTRPPLPICHPWWRIETGLDLDAHVRELVLPTGTAIRELCRQVSELSVEPLDRGLPLWRMWLCRGLEGGRSAVLVKIHHSAGDGFACRRLIEALFGEPAEVPSTLDSALRHSPTSNLSAMLRSIRRTVASLRPMIGGIKQALDHNAAQSDAGVARARAPFSGDSPPWGINVTRERQLAVAELSLSQIRRVRESQAVSTHDVLSAVLGGALHPLLPPATELTAVIPISTRLASDDPWGNRTSYFFGTLGTNIDEPVARLGLVAQESEVARRRRSAEGIRALAETWELYPLQRAVRVLLEGSMSRFRGRVTASVILSSLPGPDHLSHDGVDVEQIFSFGPLATGMLVNVTAWSYDDVLAVGVVVCPSQDLDPWVIADALPTQLAALAGSAA